MLISIFLFYSAFVKQDRKLLRNSQQNIYCILGTTIQNPTVNPKRLTMINIPVIREIDQSELHFLDDMLYEAIFIPEGVEKLPRDIIKHPDLFKYIKNFGQIGDICLVAELQGKLVGAIWTRMFSENDKGYGFVDKDTPELSMALYEEHRHKGIGKLLLKKIIQKLTEKGYRQVSLSVDKQNYAFGFYKRNGFKKHESTDKSVTMIKKLK